MASYWYSGIEDTCLVRRCMALVGCCVVLGIIQRVRILRRPLATASAFVSTINENQIILIPGDFASASRSSESRSLNFGLLYVHSCFKLSCPVCDESFWPLYPFAQLMNGSTYGVQAPLKPATPLRGAPLSCTSLHISSDTILHQDRSALPI
jgi:hypothetical protein